MGRVLLCRGGINITQVCSSFPQYHLFLISLVLSAIPLMPNTRKKNQSAHPGLPDMTPSQLSSAGLSRGSTTRRPLNKKLTKDQQIAALKDELRAVQEHMSSVSHFIFPHMYLDALTNSLIVQSRSAAHDDQTRASPDTGGDTDPATDAEETQMVTVGTKRKISASARSASTCVLSFLHRTPISTVSR